LPSFASVQIAWTLVAQGIEQKATKETKERKTMAFGGTFSLTFVPTRAPTGLTRFTTFVIIMFTTLVVFKGAR
jgi:hypothetical protein